MNRKSEKQIEAARLRDKIIRIKTNTVESGTRKYDVCLVNDSLYIRKGTITCLDAPLTKLQREGKAKESDFLHGVSQVYVSRRGLTEKLVIFVRADFLLAYKDYILNQTDNSGWTTITEGARMMYEVLERLPDEDTASNVFTENEIELSEELYRKRVGLIKEANDERKYSSRNKPEDALSSLVRKIEDMGWHVTLTLKDNG